jgi:hypothetical protein
MVLARSSPSTPLVVSVQVVLKLAPLAAILRHVPPHSTSPHTRTGLFRNTSVASARSEASVASSQLVSISWVSESEYDPRGQPSSEQPLPHAIMTTAPAVLAHRPSTFFDSTR